MLQNESWTCSLLLEVYHWLNKVFSNRNGSWSVYHRSVYHNTQNQLNSANHVVSVFAGNIQWEFSMVAFNEILFYISYSLRLAFRLCSSMILFYTSLAVIKLAFLENKSRYVYCILKQKVNQCLKKKWSYVYFTEPISNFIFLVFLLSSWTRKWEYI